MTPDPALMTVHARLWIGTPYHHQASLRGVGCDCLGLIRGVLRDLEGFDREVPPPYSPDWSEVTGDESLLAAAARWLDSVDTASPGDVLVFRYRNGCPAKHCGIVSGDGRMIHAIEKAGVIEASIGSWWERRIAGRFRYRAIGPKCG
jgi:NlpC/P60 family putative phage cell wall peptidase